MAHKLKTQGAGNGRGFDQFDSDRIAKPMGFGIADKGAAGLVETEILVADESGRVGNEAELPGIAVEAQHGHVRAQRVGDLSGIARRLALCSLAAMAIYQLRAASGDPIHAQVIQRIATLGGWLGRKRDPIGPIVLMKGMLRFLGTLDLLDQFGLDGVWDMARSLSDSLGLPLPGVSEPLRKPRRSSRPAPSARPVANV